MSGLITFLVFFALGNASPAASFGPPGPDLDQRFGALLEKHQATGSRPGKEEIVEMRYGPRLISIFLRHEQKLRDGAYTSLTASDDSYWRLWRADRKKPHEELLAEFDEQRRVNERFHRLEQAAKEAAKVHQRKIENELASQIPMTIEQCMDEISVGNSGWKNNRGEWLNKREARLYCEANRKSMHLSDIINRLK